MRAPTSDFTPLIHATICGQAAAEAVLIRAATKARDWFFTKTEPCLREMDLAAEIDAALALHRIVWGNPEGGVDAREHLVKLRDAIADYLTPAPAGDERI